MDDFVDLLDARSGIVCAVGAGGKKTTLYALARRHPGRIALTTTVQNTNSVSRFIFLTRPSCVYPRFVMRHRGPMVAAPRR